MLLEFQILKLPEAISPPGREAVYAYFACKFPDLFINVYEIVRKYGC
ncbi:hypothetical protein PanWU01x14_202990 [Parasponia andersonii]|uniref:Uncharacterized protein n=1 Tax=Parasponia andersonii TaxID=3476 RepID=A0A2P5BWX9_PARAD|nr:hypothetical protein PanWU01x14_202990 [Parasponia andersonii]